MAIVVSSEGPGQIVDPAVDLPAYQSGDPAALVAQATALVRRYCGWHVTPVISETVTAETSGGALMLPTLNLQAVTAFDIDGAVVSAEAFRVHKAGYLSSAPGGFVAGTATVTMTHGYDSAPEVAAVIMAVVSRAQASPDGAVRRQVGQVSEAYSQTGFNAAGGVSLLDHEKAILDHYRLPPRP